MRLKKLFVVFSFTFVLAGCFRPKKPIVEVCELDASSAEGICGLSGQGAATNTIRFPISELDKSTMFRPKEWKKVKDYYDTLEIYANQLEQHCK